MNGSAVLRGVLIVAIVPLIVLAATGSAAEDIAGNAEAGYSFAPSDIREVLAAPYPGSNVVDLGAKGLEPGDVIDPYLEDWVADDTQVHIPEGTYRLTSIQIFRGIGNASIVGAGEVVLDRGDLHDAVISLRPNGDFLIKNVTLKGRGSERPSGSGINLATSNPDAAIVLQNVKMNDGAVQGDAGGIFIFPEHAGKAYLIDLEIAGFPDNGMYGSAPGIPDRGQQGEVHVYGGVYKNNNISNIRIGSHHSSIRNAVSIHDELAPPYATGARNQRGIWIQQPGQDLRIEDCDFIQTVGWHAMITDGSGKITNIRIHTESDRPAIRTDANWSGDGIHITGSGAKDITGGNFTNVLTGEDAEPPSIPGF